MTTAEAIYERALALPESLRREALHYLGPDLVAGTISQREVGRFCAFSYCWRNAPADTSPRELG